MAKKNNDEKENLDEVVEETAGAGIKRPEFTAVCGI